MALQNFSAKGREEMKHHPMFHTFFYMEVTYIRLAKASHMTAAYSMGAEKCKVPVGQGRRAEASPEYSKWRVFNMRKQKLLASWK